MSALTEFLSDTPPFASQDDNLDVTTFSVLKLEKNSVQISNLAPGTPYLFRVQALSSDSVSGGSSMEEQFETLPEGIEKNHGLTWCVHEWIFPDMYLKFSFCFQDTLLLTTQQ